MELKEIDKSRSVSPQLCIDSLIQRVHDLESELALNASMLAKQTDLAREAETRAMEAERKLAQSEERARELKTIVGTIRRLPNMLRDAVAEIEDEARRREKGEV